MSISKGAFGQSAKRAFIESAKGARGWGLFPIVLTGANPGSGATPSGIGLRNYTDDGTALVEAWNNQNGNYSSHSNYDATACLFSFVTISSEPGRLRLTDRDGTTLWTRQLTEASNGSMIPGFLRGDKVFYYYLNSSDSTYKLRAVDRETGATVQWTCPLTNADYPNGIVSRGFYVDASQTTYILYRHYVPEGPSTDGYIYHKLMIVDSSGSVTSDSTIHTLTIPGTSSWTFPLQTDLSVSAATYLVPHGTGFIATGVRFMSTAFGGYGNYEEAIMRFGRDAALDYLVYRSGSTAIPTPAFVANGKLFARLGSGTVLAWYTASTGAFVDSMFTGNSGIYAAPTELSDEVYLAGSQDGSGYEVGRANITDKTIVWEQDIINTGTSRTVTSMRTRPWPA